MGSCKKLKIAEAAYSTKLTFLPYVVKALAVAMKKFLVLLIDDASSRNCLLNYINIGIVDTDLGLFVPISKMRILRACLVLQMK